MEQTREERRGNRKGVGVRKKSVEREKERDSIFSLRPMEFGPLVFVGP